MTFFPIRRPRIGLHIGARALTVAEVGRDWRRRGCGWRLRRVQRRQVPPGLLRLSAVEKNILDVPGLAGHVRGLVGRWKGRCIALGLPDHCARVALFDFETLPRKPVQVDALLRWRFQKDLSVAVGDARMPYQVFHAKPVPGQSPRRIVRVLAAAVREVIVSQYEQMCGEAGVIPVAIGLSSLALLDSCRAAMTAASDNALFLHLADDGFTFVAFQQGCPVYFRVKALQGDSASSSGCFGEQLAQEVSATVHFYAERYLGTLNRLGFAAGPLYLVNGCERLEPLPFPEEHGQDLDACLLGGAIADPPSLKIITLDWDVLRLARSQSGERLPASGMPAVAALLAA